MPDQYTNEQLVGNALDFIHRAALEMDETSLDEHQRLKYSTMHLYEGIELLLKARLVMQHWSLIIRRPDQYKPKGWETGDFISVTYEECRGRLQAYCGVRLDAEHESFDALRLLRNRYVHFWCGDSPIPVLSRQLDAWHHILAFLDRNSLGRLSYEQQRKLAAIKRLMLAKDELLQRRLADAQPRIQDARDVGSAVVDCPYCGQESLLIGDARIDCPVCGEEDMYAETVAEDAWGSAGACSECEYNAVVEDDGRLVELINAAIDDGRLVREAGEDTYLCLACGSPWGARHRVDCGWCGAVYFTGADRTEATCCPVCERYN